MNALFIKAMKPWVDSEQENLYLSFMCNTAGLQITRNQLVKNWCSTCLLNLGPLTPIEWKSHEDCRRSVFTDCHFWSHHRKMKCKFCYVDQLTLSVWSRALLMWFQRTQPSYKRLYCVGSSVRSKTQVDCGLRFLARAFLFYVHNKSKFLRLGRSGEPQLTLLLLF